MEVVSVLKELIGVASVEHVPVAVRLCLIALWVGSVGVSKGLARLVRAAVTKHTRL